MRPDSEAPGQTQPRPDDGPALPTAPCSVVWSRGHAYVLESVEGRPKWQGVDDRGRAVQLSCADLQRRGWTRSPRGHSHRSGAAAV
jgi:hypothetical protein